jgi:hypothetical protein
MPTNPDLHADLAAKHSIYAGQDRANNSIFGKVPDPGRVNAIKERFKSSRTSGNPITQGETKTAIGANKSDPGRGLASAVREINSDDTRMISEPALQTATKALQGQRDITQRASSLNLKAQAALKGGGGEGESEKLSELGSTQDEINKAKKATKGFNIVPEGF